MTPSRSRERERPCVPVHGVQVLRGELSMGERACRRVAWPLVHAELSHAHHFRRARFPLLILHQGASSPRRSRGIPPTPFHLLQPASRRPRSEEHTSELQSPKDLVCRLLLEK